MPISRLTRTLRRGAEDDGGWSEPEPVVKTEKSDIEWDEDPVIPHRAGNEDVVPWKLCVLKELSETVLQENHD